MMARSKSCLDCGIELKGHGNPKRCRKCAWKADYDRRVESMRAAVYDNPEIRANRIQAVRIRWADPNARRYGKPAKRESEVAKLLAELGATYIHQYNPMGCRWVYDFYLPDFNLLLELDGNEHRQQTKSIKRDAEKDSWALEHGYNIGRLWEEDLNSLTADALAKELLLV